MKDQKERGFEILENKNLYIDVEDFDPHNSQVTISVKPTIGEWNTLNETTKVMHNFMNEIPSNYNQFYTNWDFFS